MLKATTVRRRWNPGRYRARRPSPGFQRGFSRIRLDWDWDVPLYGELLAVTGGKERMKYYIERFRPDYRRPADFDQLVAELHKAKTRPLTPSLPGGRGHSPASRVERSAARGARPRPYPGRGHHTTHPGEDP